MTYYKVLDGVHATNGGDYRYPGVGRWTRHLDPGRIKACRYGYHLASGETQLLDWFGPTIYVAEPCPDHDVVDAANKMVTCRVRLVRKTVWDDRVARLFAADCAEAALLGERAYGREPDVRSWEAVEVAHRYANGFVTDEERAAAWAAAWAVARAAVWTDAGEAVWAAAGVAARAVAGDAAWAVAGDAAADAARATGWAAVEDDDGTATWATARTAARDALAARLGHYLNGTDPGPVVPLYGGAQ